MEPQPFDQLVRILTASAGRRRVLGLALATPLAPLFASVEETEAGRKKQRRKRKKRKNKRRIVVNSFGCVDVGQKCFGRNDLCCSGICDGDPETSVCLAHNVLTCQPSADTCSENVPCGANGVCFGTTGNAPFCGRDGTCFCKACAADIDCVATHGAGAACVQCLSDCNGVGGSSGTACVPAALA
ncbi:MAG: hypothetical protein QM692_08610 [Thermomicrobiales bacterium]